MRDFWKDVGFGLRLQLKAPATSPAVVATLAVGIAACTVAFSLLDALCLRPLPAREPPRPIRASWSSASCSRSWWWLARIS